MGYQPTSTAVTALVCLLFCLGSTARVVDGKSVVAREHSDVIIIIHCLTNIALLLSSNCHARHIIIVFLIDAQHAILACNLPYMLYKLYYTCVHIIF